MKRSIGVVTGARSDYGVLRPLLRRIASDPRLELRLYVTGAHLSSRFGLTVREIEKDGLPIAERIPILGRTVAAGDDAARALAKGVAGFSRVFARRKPDLLFLMSDRYEMLAAASAAMFHNLVVAHLSGGKTTQGSADEYVRHAVTKMSHYHFTHNAEHRRRILAMGEHPSRVFAFGSPVLDEVVGAPSLSRERTAYEADLDLSEEYVVVLYHPETLDTRPAEAQMAEVLKAVGSLPMRAVLVYPGADAGSEPVIGALRRFAAKSGAALIKNLPRPLFLSLLRHSRALVGNSSCGITDAPSLGVPAVNVGDRQRGMVRARNVIDCPCGTGAIRAAIARAARPAFRSGLRGLYNPYGDGKAGARIVAKLRELPLGPEVLKKAFYDGGK